MKPPNAWVIASALVCEDGKVLLLEEERLGRRQLNTPGGRVRPYEHPGATAIRETKEETGLDIRILDIAAVIQGTWPEGGTNFVRLIFRAERIGGQEQPEKTSRIIWVPLEELHDPQKYKHNIMAIEEDSLRDFANHRTQPYVYFYQTTENQFLTAPITPE